MGCPDDDDDKMDFQKYVSVARRMDDENDKCIISKYEKILLYLSINVMD
jgi:hypothetical protein